MSEMEVNLAAELEKEGEPTVRTRFERGEFGFSGTKSSWVKSWLDSKASVRRDDREAETLEIARKARSSARMANIIAIMAMLLSVIMAIIGLNK